MFIYSGKCRLGKCGDNTHLRDCSGNALFVGDIVITSTIDNFGIWSNCRLSAVVSERYQSFSDGTHKERDQEIDYFVMGIKGVDFMVADSEKWRVKKVKSFSECVDGEHWKDYGFNYKED